jgi:hypothetical protein
VFTPDTEGKISIDFKVAGLVPGSAIAGATTDLESLVHAEFSVTILNEEKVNVCEGNTLWLGDLTEVGPKKSRPQTVTY